MKNMSKNKYDNIVKSYWEEFFIILIVAGVSIILSAVFYNPQDEFAGIAFAALTVVCLLMEFIVLYRLRDFKNHYRPRDYSSENARRQDR